MLRFEADNIRTLNKVLKRKTIPRKLKIIKISN